MTAGPGGRLGRRDRRARRRPTSPTLAELSFPAMELYAMPAATATLLDDARSTSTSGSPRRSSRCSPTQEGTAFVTGDGINKPKGFLAYTTVANASWSWGKLGYVATGVAGAFPAERPVRRADRPRSTR